MEDKERVALVVMREIAKDMRMEQIKAEQKVKVLIAKPKPTKAGEIFGKLKLKKSTHRLMVEVDKALDIS